MKRHLINWIVLITGTLCSAQSDQYPQNYFQLPVNRAVLLSGTFGELRPGHFHAGIDIKSVNGKSGESIVASADGYVTRINVSPYGYGNALYIAHPNGYTTVYCHLDGFSPEIAAYVKRQQYAQRRFRINVYPRPDQFKIKRGDVIGTLGNSGSSFGPHLHFEIRRTADQVPVNPLHFGLRVSDNIPPDIEAVRIIMLDEELNTLDYRDLKPEMTAPGKYTLDDTLSIAAWRTGVAIKSRDRMEGAPNRNGIYRVEMFVDEQPHYSFTFDEVSFGISRYLNAHIEPLAQIEGLGRYHRGFKVKGNKLPIYEPGTDNGAITLYREKVRRVEIAISDHNQNTATLKFFVRRGSVVARNGEDGIRLEQGVERRIQEDGFEFLVPANGLYEDRSVAFSVADSFGLISPLYTLEPALPLHNYGKVSLSVPAAAGSYKNKLCILHIDDDTVSLGGDLEGGMISAATRSLGTFTLGTDTIPPDIEVVEFKEDLSGASRMRFRITDNYPTSGKADNLSFAGMVDGQWILFEYDAKNDLLTHHFDEKIAPGKHSLRLTVTDDRKNTAVFERSFVR